MITAQKIKLKHPYIITAKSHCGGAPIIAGTKFPVRSIVFYVLRQGMTPEELVKEFSHINLPQVYDALSYYYENKKAVDKELREYEEEFREKAAV
jgi:uncharacterized protein (DUF433 family)